MTVIRPPNRSSTFNFDGSQLPVARLPMFYLLSRARVAALLVVSLVALIFLWSLLNTDDIDRVPGLIGGGLALGFSVFGLAYWLKYNNLPGWIGNTMMLLVSVAGFVAVFKNGAVTITMMPVVLVTCLFLMNRITFTVVSTAYLVAALYVFAFQVNDEAINYAIRGILGIISITLTGQLFFVFAQRYIEEKENRERELEQALETVEKNNQTQAKLFAIIGHELRTPVAALSMMLDQESPPREQMKSTTHHLLNVLDDMRAVVSPHKVITGKLSNASLYDTVLRAVAVQERMLQESRLTINIEGDADSKVTRTLNEQLIRQITLNMVKNAVFHSGASEMWISMRSQPKADHCACEIRYADNGKGISEQHRSSLFDAFVRGDTEADGSGLGLHLSRQLAQDQLRGDLTYEDRPGGGATFVLTLRQPLSTQPHAEMSTTMEKTQRLKGLRILFAEDNELIRVMASELLSERGAKVSAANNGEVAWRLFQTHDFDVVITDLFMPETDGFELTRRIRELDSHLPIIGVTAASVGQETEEILAAGASAVQLKPIDINILEDQLAELLPAAKDTKS